MHDITTNKLGQMGRRRFMKTLSALGVSATAINHMSKEALADLTDNPGKEIPRLKGLRHTNHEAVVEGTEAPDLEPVYYTIPRDEFVRIEGTYNAAKEIDEQIGEERIEVSVERPTGRSDDLSITVEHQTLKGSEGDSISPDVSASELRELLPNEVDGQISVGDRQFEVENIPVRVQEVGLVYDNYYDSRYRPVPGGCMMNGDCTIGHPAYDNDAGEYVWTTAAHCVDRSSGKAIFQPYYDKNVSDGHYIGDSDKYIPKGDGDAATIMPKYDDTASNVEYRYAENDGTYTDWFIYGTRSSDYLKDMAANGESVYKQGMKTGRLYDKVLKVSSNGEKVTLECDRDGGDSGGPYFDVNSYDEAYAVGIHAWGVDYDGDGTYDDSKGNTMEYVNNYLNLSL